MPNLSLFRVGLNSTKIKENQAGTNFRASGVDRYMGSFPLNRVLRYSSMIVEVESYGLS